MTEEKATIEFSNPRIEITNEEKSKIVPGDLRSKGEVLKTAEVTAAQVEEAIAKWKDDPPLDDFEKILESEAVDD